MNLTDSIRLIKERIPLLSLLRDYGITLKRSGPGYLMLCPWHSEKHPSCRVYESHCHCYTCSSRGDVIDVYALLEGIPKGRAIRQLAAQAGVTIDHQQQSRLQRFHDTQEREFARWWQSKVTERMGLRLSAYVRWLDLSGGTTEEECDVIGLLLRQVKGVSGERLTALMRASATNEERAEYERFKDFGRQWLDLAAAWDGTCHGEPGSVPHV